MRPELKRRINIVYLTRDGQANNKVLTAVLSPPPPPWQNKRLCQLGRITQDVILILAEHLVRSTMEEQLHQSAGSNGLQTPV